MATTRNVDFTNVKEGGNFNKARIPSGDYLALVTKVEDAESKSDQSFQYLFTIQIKSRPSSKFPYYCKLAENQLWKLRNLLIAAGLSVPKRRMKVDPDKVVGKLIGVTIDDTEYDGKEQSEITGIFPASELSEEAGSTTSDDVDDDDDTDEDEDLGSVGTDDDEDEAEEAEEPEDEEETEEESGDEYDSMDRAALKAALKKNDPDFKARTSQSDDDLRDMLRAAKATPQAAPKAAKKKPSEVTEDELDELDIDNL